MGSTWHVTGLSCLFCLISFSGFSPRLSRKSFRNSSFNAVRYFRNIFSSWSAFYNTNSSFTASYIHCFSLFRTISKQITKARHYITFRPKYYLQGSRFQNCTHEYTCRQFAHFILRLTSNNHAFLFLKASNDIVIISLVVTWFKSY